MEVKDLKTINSFKSDFDRHRSESAGHRISTGILSLDCALNGGLTNELYILGAETSTGKSAFMMWLAQNAAENGNDVLYFALEMGKDEFIARGISMISFEANRKDNKNKCYTAGDILYWPYDKETLTFQPLPADRYDKYEKEYFKRYGNHLYIIEGGTTGLSAKDISEIASAFKEKHSGQSPVVFVDYLQILKADHGSGYPTDRKAKMDNAVTTLKTLASQQGMPVLTISSISRSSYKEKVGTSSFKESGDTEYTGGILFGWNQADVSTKSTLRKDTNAHTECRKMVLEILKYRNAARNSGIDLAYYPGYSFFEEYNKSLKRPKYYYSPSNDE